MSQKELALVSYILTGAYGVVAYYWYRTGKREGYATGYAEGTTGVVSNAASGSGSEGA